MTRRLRVKAMNSTNSSIKFLVQSVDDGPHPIAIEVELSYTNKKIISVTSRFLDVFELSSYANATEPNVLVLSRFKDTLIKSVKLIIKDFLILDL